MLKRDAISANGQNGQDSKSNEETHATEGSDSSSSEYDNGYAIRSLARGLAVLRCFDMEHPEWSLGDVARATRLNKVTVFRLIKTLQAEGFLGFDPTTARYHLGTAILPLSYLGTSHKELSRMAKPAMRKLAEKTGESVDLAVHTVDGVMFIAQVLTSRPFKPAATIGRVFGDLNSCHSKVFLAFSPSEVRERALSKPWEALTPHTIVERECMEQELRKVVQAGIAYDYQEQTLGICGAAVPVYDALGEVRATLSIVAPIERFNPEDVEVITQALIEAGMALSRELGYKG
jgi:IclR family pca regulon transcriptional regulator